jgi:glycosyltransferase involved in cell wall biosynthesis
MGGPLVSVVMPVYQGERYLGEALDSALAQEYEPLEIIVVDDGSTDASAAIARARPVRYVRLEHQGLARARNAGIEAARGEIVAFLDADDVWLPGGLEARVSHLLANPELGYVLSRMEVFFEPGTERPSWIRERVLSEPQHGFFQTFVGHRRVFDEVGLFDPAFEPSDDIDWFARAKDAGVASFELPQVCARYRVHDDSLTSRQSVMPTLLRALKSSIDRRRDPAGPA